MRRRKKGSRKAEREGEKAESRRVSCLSWRVVRYNHTRVAFRRAKEIKGVADEGTRTTLSLVRSCSDAVFGPRIVAVAYVGASRMRNNDHLEPTRATPIQ